MNPGLSFCLVLHNHQPVGNFDFVFENAYRESYLPFLDVFEPYETLRITLHISGPLLDWLDDHHPEYLDRLARLVRAGRVEILGGPMYEPILTMLPPRDRLGQITAYTDRLTRRLGGRIRGMWVPERVWEPGLVSDIAAAGIAYTVLDDFHFRCAGLADDVLHGIYQTEDAGRTIRIFPGSERLRYLIPFQEPEATLGFLRKVAGESPETVIVFGDDGEKFGTWPDTYEHVYNGGWLRSFFDLLAENADWLQTTTLGEAAERVPVRGRVYLPDASYREMTEWALPADRQRDLERISGELGQRLDWPTIRSLMRGGTWRNFRVKYPESGEMYARMMEVSRRLADFEAHTDPRVEAARRALYRGQCNCPYWHGAFGGIYLPHLRHAVYRELITAENLLDDVEERGPGQLEAVADDFDFDGHNEIRLTNHGLSAYVAPARGGVLYELDLRTIGHNALATLARRDESYHDKVRRGARSDDEGVSSIHDRIVFKQDNLDQLLLYDDASRKSMRDRFLSETETPEALWRGTAVDHGDFACGRFEARLRERPGCLQLVLMRRGRVDDHPVTLTKTLTLEASQPVLDVTYELANLPASFPYRLAVEWSFSGLPKGAPDRYFFDAGGEPLGDLGTWLIQSDSRAVGLADDWLGLRIAWQGADPARVWTFPIETVSQSEGGFEAIHQSVSVVTSWAVRPDAEGRWETSMRWSFETPRHPMRLGQQASADCQLSASSG